MDYIKMYLLEIKEEADKIFSKLAKRDINQLRIIQKKIKKIISQPNHTYKFLKKPLQRFNRIHINDSFVLIFKIDHIRKTIVIYYFGHHDKVYQWRPPNR